MKAETYFDLKDQIIALGYEYDVTWAENVKPPKTSDEFSCEHCFVVCNAGMKAQVAINIHRRVWDALVNYRDPYAVFGHKGKVQAIEHVYMQRQHLFAKYLLADDKLAFLESLPWIGKITKYHLAKNFGFDCCKPDRHLVRIAKQSGETPEELCRRLSEETGNRIGVVDLVIWRAANLGLA